MIVSNPPYIYSEDKNKVESNVLNYEPHEALFVSKDPLYFYKKILKFSRRYLNQNGNIYFEINDKYESELELLFSELECKFIKDIYGKKRFLFVSIT